MQIFLDTIIKYWPIFGAFGAFSIWILRLQNSVNNNTSGNKEAMKRIEKIYSEIKELIKEDRKEHKESMKAMKKDHKVFKGMATDMAVIREKTENLEKRLDNKF